MILTTKARSKNKTVGKSTLVRIDNMKILLDYLATTEMTERDMCDLLSYSQSGARKYKIDLLAAGVIELVRYDGGTREKLGTAVFSITADKNVIESFRLNLLSGDPKAAPTSNVTKDKYPGRHFHVMSDDVHYAIRVDRMVIRRDPLVAALYGPARAQAAA